jgi:ribonuclease P protein component
VDEHRRPEERITRRADSQRIYQQGARTSGRFMTVFTLPNQLPVMRLGVSATRKLGSAVARNRAKRLAREIFRRHKLHAGMDVVVIPRREMLDADFGSLEADYCSLLRRRVRQGRSH